MKTYVIERDIEGIGGLTEAEYQEGSAVSNAALAELAPDVQWVQSFVTQDKLFCVYRATDKDVIRKHADMSGFPAHIITETVTILDPTRAAA